MRLCLAMLLAASASESMGSDEFLGGAQRAQLAGAIQDARGVHERHGDQIPIYAGLPASLSARLPENEGFVAFHGIDDADDVPLGSHWESAPDTDVERLIEEDSWALLPPGSAIRRGKDPSGAPAWDYPAGTRLLHRIFFKSVPERTLFEIRYSEKRPDGKWAMGLYHPRGGLRTLSATGPLRLNRQDDAKASFDVPLASGSVHVRVERLRPDSCRHCHWAMGHADYPDPEHAGPCGFVPANAGLAEWARAYEKRHGASPFSSAGSSM